ncbi:MAG: ribose 5-phosphate isomerase B [Ruminococcaceae bacterium]|nr:ribose 5-phosphate isomerase B [Oscillospiraceae bacterium]
MKLYIACDHAAIEMKDEITAYLREKGHDVEDLGINVGEKIDYPVAAEKVARKVVADNTSRGILICGTGIGMSIAANKVKGVRAAAVSEVYSAKLTRIHNNSNIICFGARVIGIETAKMIVDAYLEAEFEDGGRHAARVDLITKLEENF